MAWNYGYGLYFMYKTSHTIPENGLLVIYKQCEISFILQDA